MSAKDWAQHFGTLWQIAVNEGSPWGGGERVSWHRMPSGKWPYITTGPYVAAIVWTQWRKRWWHPCITVFLQMTGLAMNSAPQEWTPGAFFKKHSPSIKCQGHTTSWSTLPSTRKSLLLTWCQSTSGFQKINCWAGVCLVRHKTQMNVCTAWFGLAVPRTILHPASVSSLLSPLLPEFNFGAAASQDTANFFGFETGHHMKRLGAARMQRRVQNSIKYVKDRRNKRRDKVRAAKLKRLEELLVLEGGPAYAAGQFWSVGGVLHAVGHLHMLYWRYCVSFLNKQCDMNWWCFVAFFCVSQFCPFLLSGNKIYQELLDGLSWNVAHWYIALVSTDLPKDIFLDK